MFSNPGDKDLYLVDARISECNFCNYMHNIYLIINIKRSRNIFILKKKYMYIKIIKNIAFAWLSFWCVWFIVEKFNNYLYTTRSKFS